MPIETPIDDLSSLNAAWPLDTDLQSTADDHMRLTQDAPQKAFTDLTANGGVVSATATELNQLVGTTRNIQQQLDEVDALWRVTSAGAVSANAGGDKILTNHGVPGVVITLPDTPLAGTQVDVQDLSGLAAPPDNTVVVQASGSDTIFDVFNSQTAPTYLFFANGQYSFFIYNSGVWYAFTRGLPVS